MNKQIKIYIYIYIWIYIYMYIYIYVYIYVYIYIYMWWFPKMGGPPNHPNFHGAFSARKTIQLVGHPHPPGVVLQPWRRGTAASPRRDGSCAIWRWSRAGLRRSQRSLALKNPVEARKSQGKWGKMRVFFRTCGCSTLKNGDFLWYWIIERRNLPAIESNIDLWFKLV